MVEKAAQDKKSQIINAQAEAEAARLIGQALKKNNSFIELKRLETAQQIARTIARSRNKVFLDSDSLLLNITGRMDENLEKIGSVSKNEAGLKK